MSRRIRDSGWVDRSAAGCGAGCQSSTRSRAAQTLRVFAPMTSGISSGVGSGSSISKEDRMKIFRRETAGCGGDAVRPTEILIQAANQFIKQ